MKKKPFRYVVNYLSINKLFLLSYLGAYFLLKLFFHEIVYKNGFLEDFFVDKWTAVKVLIETFELKSNWNGGCEILSTKKS